MTIESQLDTLITKSTETNTLLTQMLEIMQGDGPCPPDPGPDPGPGPTPEPGEELLFSYSGWKVGDIGDASKPWRDIERPHEGTVKANLSFANGKIQFNKKEGSPAGYGSSVVARNFPAGAVDITRLRVIQEVTYLDSWIATNGCKHAFWSTYNGTNHCFATFNNYDGKLRPSVLTQQPFFNYYCDFVITKGVPYVFEWTADFKAKTLEMKVDGVARKINPTAWVAPSVLKVENVNYGFDHLPYNQYQFDPTEPACPDGVDVMTHQYGPVSVYGVRKV